jgi:glyoxylate/hydroxypyruvate reductase A
VSKRASSDSCPKRWASLEGGMSVLYKSDIARGRSWARIFAEKAPDIEFHVWPETGDLAAVEYLIAWEPPPGLLTTLPNLKVLFSSGAGVDHLDLSTVPSHVPVVRMVEPGIVNGMVEYVTLSVLALHRNLLDYIRAQRAGAWQQIEVAPASARSVGVMGLGVLGQAVLERLGAFGYTRYGWNRSPKQIPGVTCYTGTQTLERFLGRCDILVCLLPLTPATQGILNRGVFAALPPGASLINVGRGGHLDSQALVDALDSGHLSAAILDVCEPEPLPPSHPFWSHPRILLTPHIASMTQPETAALVVLENIRRYERGEPLRDVIDRRRGY